MFSSQRARAAALGAVMALGTASAETIQVKAQGVRFLPDIIHANVGDVIAFRNMATQRVQDVPGMWPDGAPPMSSDMGADYDYVVEREGLYVFKCPPHWGARMGGILAIGNTTDFQGKATEYAKIAATDRAAKPATGLLKKFSERLATRTLP
jgi:plastocyanin